MAQSRTWPGWRPAVASRTCVSQQMPHPGYRRWQTGAEPLEAPSWLLICSKHRRWTVPRGYQWRCRKSHSLTSNVPKAESRCTLSLR